MLKLSKRQQDILNFIVKNKNSSSKEIKKYIETKHDSISRITIIRDLDFLLKNKLIQKKGKGRNVVYQEFIKSSVLKYFDSEEYFKVAPDKRNILPTFNFNVFNELVNIFSKNELAELMKLNDNYKNELSRLSPAIIKKEFERLTIELSWKSSQIEGNTYSLIDTEILIKEQKEAVGHKREEAIMILNHKKALDYIRDKKSDFKKLTLAKIENIHSLLINGLNITKGLRKRPVGIIGTTYKPIDNEYQIKEALQKLISIVNKTKDVFTKTLISILMISYIQPFEDGNKRTSRLLGDAILLAYSACPLSYRSIDEAEYKKAIILFYEQNSLRYFKELFIEQYKFVVENYFRS